MSKVASDSNDHWKRLAAELGLELDPEPEPEPAEAEPPKPATAPEPFAEAIETDVEGDVVEAPIAEEFREVEAVEFETVSVEAEPVGDADGSAAQPAADGERPRRRGRRRSRRKKGEERSEEAAVSATATADDEDADNPAEAVRDWNIPSWNDLIASLYRPER